MHENHQSHIEGIFSRGDRRVADVLEAAFRLGCRFDGWDDELRARAWDQAIADERRRRRSATWGPSPSPRALPWDHIDIGLEPDFLAKEYRKALKDRLSPPCGKPFKQLLHPNNVGRRRGARREEADLLRLRRRLRPRRDEGGAALLPAPHERLAPPGPARGARGRSDRSSARRGTRSPAARARRRRGRRAAIGCATPSWGGSRILGHLDLVRHLPRIFRRAGFELYYSVGFHPKPELSFGPALGLGIPSLGELLDVTLIDDVEPDELLRSCRGSRWTAIELLDAVRLGDNDRALGRVIAETEFAARLPAGSTSAAALARCGGRRAAARAPRVRQGSEKGIARTIDVRQRCAPWSVAPRSRGGAAPARLARRRDLGFRVGGQPRRERPPRRGRSTALWGAEVAAADVAAGPHRASGAKRGSTPWRWPPLRARASERRPPAPAAP